MLALISGRKRKELLMSNKTRVGWFIWGYLDVYWRRLFNCVLPLGTQQNAIEVLYLLNEETLAHERRYIQLHDHNLIIVYKYKDVDVFISDVYRQERQQKTSCRHNKKETNGREYESLFTQLKSSILKLRKHQSDALSLIAKDSGFLYAKSLQDESVFSTKSFEVSLEAFLRKGEVIRVSLKLWRFSVVIMEILSLFTQQPKITWENITGHSKTLGQWQEVKEMP